MNARAHIHYSNMPYSEEYRINGTLCRKSIEELIDYFDATSNVLDNLSSAIDEIKEAKGCFPEEDALSKTVERLEALSKRIRAFESKCLLEQITEEVRSHITSLQQSAEYGDEKLTSAINLLNIKDI